MRKHRIFVAMFAALSALTLSGVAQVWAQNGNGVISFVDFCAAPGTPWKAYVMRGEAESETSNPRIVLPEEPVPQPPPPFRSQGLIPLDISTSGPVTVLLRGNFGTYFVQVDDIGGNLTPGTAIGIGIGASVGLAKFSPTGDRVALVVSGGQLVVADIVRDGSLKITGLANATVVHPDLHALGDPLDSNITNTLTLGGVDGTLDFSPSGTQIVVTIYGDLWLLSLSSDGHTLLSSEPLTRTVGDSEWHSAFSPDGNKLAYIGGPNSRASHNEFFLPDARNSDIFVLDLGTGAVTQLTGRRSPFYPAFPAWSPDGQFLAFAADGQRTPRGTCNPSRDIYQIEADGAGSPILLTNTVGTGREEWSQWGW